MPDSQIAYAVLESLTDPLHGLEFDATGIRSSHTLTLVTEAGDVNAAVNPSLNTQSSVSSIQAVIPEDWSRLDWTVAAPDM